MSLRPTLPHFEGHENQIRDFQQSSMVALLEQDDRPIFVIDLSFPVESNPIYYNPVLGRNKGLRDRVSGLSSLYALKQAHRQGADWNFLQWQRSANAAGHAHSSRYAQMYWIATTVNDRWRVISGVLAVQNISAQGTKFVGPGAPDEPSSSLKSKEVSEARSLSVPLEGARDSYSKSVELKRKPSSQGSSPAANGTARIEGSGPEKSPEKVYHQDSGSNTVKSPLLQPSTLPGLPEPFLISVADSKVERLGPYDWTVPDPGVRVTPFVRWFRNMDWAATKLGPIQNWSTQLRGHCIDLMADPRASAMYWGKERVMLYNDGYSEVVGAKHPFMMGKPFAEAWPELGSAFEPSFKLAEDTGVATKMDNACFFLERKDFLEECYFSVAMTPITSDDNQTVAVYNPIFETSRQVIAERRMTFLLNLGAEIAASREPKDFWNQLLVGLEANIHEVPFALLYSAGEDVDDTLSASSEKSVAHKHWTLEGSVGYPETFVHTPKLDPEDTDNFIPSFRNAIKSSKPTLLQRSDGSLPLHIVNGLMSRAFGDDCNSAVFLPIRSTGENVLGFLILGANPRRSYDPEYQLFIELLSRQLATAMASAVLFEDETRRNRIAAELAAQDRNELSDKLAMRTHQAKEIENRFRRMADLAPVGMFHFDSTGMPIYCNENWYEITGHPRGAEYPMSWYNVIHPDDHARMDVEWARLGSGLPVSFELRLKKTFSAAEVVGGEKVEGQTCIIAAAYPEMDEDGTITGILGCLTDISRQKWSEDFQSRRTREAVELKRQQENFIDMTSHEMRNPLSAIVQCADWIGNSLSEYDTTSKNVILPAEIIDSHLDAAQTIVLCAQHQKRIIDDVLTLSKLDANLLLITPIDVQPATIIENSLKMFDGELQKSDVELRLKIEESYVEANIDWVRLDPSRVLQVLINLLTNAIKFTQPEPERRITVTVGASIKRPTDKDGIQYLPRNPNRTDLTDTVEWGTGSPIYLEVQVEDTGRGLDEHERTLLFQRFSQTSPRTHVQYGGSGLGLFISRELTELQGGEIGVRSEAGVGSTFAFFVKARRTIPPDSRAGSPDLKWDAGSSKVIASTVHGKIPGRTSSPSLPPKKTSLTVSPSSKHVLIVEDNLVNQKVLSKQLRSAGCVVSVANHGGEAIAFLKQSRFWAGNLSGKELNVVLMDLEMPVMDGLTCVKEIRRLQKLGDLIGHIPVIAVTANARSEQIATAKDSGMDGVVTKPFRIPDLIPEMERLVQKTSSKDGSQQRSLSAPAT